jgi:hypothetical protein
MLVLDQGILTYLPGTGKDIHSSAAANLRMYVDGGLVSKDSVHL